MFWERCQSGPLGGSGWRCLLRTSWNLDEAGMFRSESDLQSAQRDSCLPRPPLQDKRRQGVTSLFLLGLVQVQSFQNVHVEKIHRSYPVSQFTDRETEVQKRGLIDPKSHRIRSAYTGRQEKEWKGPLLRHLAHGDAAFLAEPSPLSQAQAWGAQ